MPSAAFAAPRYELVKVGSNGQSGRITFRGTADPDGPRHLTLAANPVIEGNNLYAPDLLRAGDGWKNYYGGWVSASDVNDRIYVGIRNGLEVNGDWSGQLAIDNGDYIHVHDPSVVRAGAQWHMVYTAARNVAGKFTDWINYSSSTNGTDWTPSAGSVSTQVTMTDPSNLAGGTISDIARPSLVKTDTGWKMWFDGKVDGSTAPSSYLAHATGATPTNFKVVHRYGDAGGPGGFPGFFEPDIARRPDGSYVGVIQRGFATLHVVTSSDGINFDVGGAVVSAGDPMFSRDKVSNPGLIYDEADDKVLGLGFGMTDSPELVGHDIGFTQTHLKVQVRSPGGVWHVYAKANLLNEQFLHVFNYTSFDLVRVIDPGTGRILVEQNFDGAKVGDIWQLQPIPEPALLAPLLLTPILLLKRRRSR